MFKNIEKNIDLIQKNRDTILDMWMSYDIVQTKLTQNTLNVDFFKDKFAGKVFDFAISVVEKKNETGDCPVIGVMLMLFKKKNIPLSDVFMICVHFKNALLHFAQENSILDDNILREISVLMDYNFEGVINEYVLLYYKDNFIPKKANLNKETQELVEVEIEDVAITQQLDSQSGTSAQLYLQEVNVDMDMIDELDELESDTLNAIDANPELDENSMHESSNLFNKYANVLNTMLEFDELAYTLNLLSDLLNDTPFDSLSDETKFMVDIYLKAIISDLQSWRMAIFITMEAEDIHYLDKTLLSSIAQMQMTLMPQVESSEDEEEIEFF